MLTLEVAGMTCGHCVAAVSNAVAAVPGAGEVSVDLASGVVRAGGHPDEAAVRAAIADEGYEVLEARNGEEAMALLAADAGRIDLLFTDVWMRGVMDGVDLSHEVSRRWPWVGILVTSAHVFLTGDRLPPGSRFIRSRRSGSSLSNGISCCSTIRATAACRSTSVTSFCTLSTN